MESISFPDLKIEKLNYIPSLASFSFNLENSITNKISPAVNFLFYSKFIKKVKLFCGVESEKSIKLKFVK